MPAPKIAKRAFRTFEIGERVTFTRTFTDGDVAAFIGATWDINPLHTDDTYAAATRFGRRILPGLLTASMATHLGGVVGFLAAEMSMQFVGPVYIGDTVTIEGVIVEFDPARRRAKVECRWTNAAGQEVLRGHFAGLAPQQSDS